MPSNPPLDVLLERGRDGPRTLTIRVRRSSGSEEVYHSLADVPADARAIIDDADQQRAAADAERREVNQERLRAGQFRKRRWGPGGIRVHETRARLRITYYWFSWAALLALATALPLCFWECWQLLHGGMASRALGTALLVFFLLILYACVAFLINRTFIEISSRKLTVRHGPLPWPGQRVLQNAAVAQLYCSYRRFRGGRMSYLVYVITADETQVRLLDDLPDAAQALYLEKQIEERLGIEDWPALSDHVRDQLP